jgi:hypothetical protein
MRGVLRQLLIASTLVLVTAGHAAAGTIVVGLTFAPGTLSVKAKPVLLAGGARVSVPVTVADGRGRGTGWTLRVAGPSTVTISSITAGCGAGSTCTLPAAAGRPSGRTVLRVARGTGMGVIDLVVTLSSSTQTAVSFVVS